MEELSNMIIKFFTDYGWQMGVCVIGGIFVLGLFKAIGIFDGIKNAQIKKALYISLSVILSAGACALYLYITHSFDWVAFGTITVPVFALNQTVYQLYEDLGIRAVWKKLLNWISGSIGKLFIGIKNKTILNLGSAGLRKLADKLDNKQTVEAKQIVEKASETVVKTEAKANDKNRNLYNNFSMKR